MCIRDSPSILALCKKDNGREVSQAMVKAWEKTGVASRAPYLNVQTTGSQFKDISGKYFYLGIFNVIVSS